MLKIVKVNEKDIDKLNTLLKKSIETDMLDSSLVIYDNEEILGYASYKQKGNIAYLNDFFIFNETMNNILKDGLIKSLLNLADINGIKLFLVEKNEDELFLKKIGFKDLSESELILDKDIQINKYLCAILPDFFDSACHSKNNNKKYI
ncbi:hypothetical protein SAMN05661008_00891 [Alkalithermobacter thermoalcaliphilus JW-YL-7 = DSM 7308]|uniref:GCN5-related N-acetyltransferase n=1 Tax=Alkalithermobacter thermoalcaliphilus JW-YL-7 = DSM 7308 TaxID=1121328 RepID=A0A150FQJ4_CLOPD|nr:GCN5-related N-acetyltransferase [[Clostridium] paradoxum JW-YL-7 = DSM 7308]SHK78667.1 hypothetical protein SAMN05661008_00891 [[Clostridium] paradoxum JW-YL-7 = DSM 7308]